MIKTKIKIAYIRASTDEQANEGYSINYQIRCERILTTKSKLGTVEKFIDD